MAMTDEAKAGRDLDAKFHATEGEIAIRLGAAAAPATVTNRFAAAAKGDPRPSRIAHEILGGANDHPCPDVKNNQLPIATTP